MNSDSNSKSISSNIDLVKKAWRHSWSERIETKFYPNYFFNNFKLPVALFCDKISMLLPLFQSTFISLKKQR